VLHPRCHYAIYRRMRIRWKPAAGGEISFKRLSAWRLMQRQTREPRYSLLLLRWIHKLNAEIITRVEPRC
jgi:hypothetical protein